MSRPAIFFDRDNTLIANDAYLGDPQRVRLVPGAAAAVAKARSLGYAVVVVSNQSGVARGMHSEDDVAAVNRQMEQMLLAEDASAVVDRQEYCPYHPEAKIEAYRQDSDLRKPKPGMILKAAGEMGLDLAASWVIGDALRDLQAGRAAGCRTILFNDPSLRASEAAADVLTAAATADAVFATLDEAMDHIATHRERPAGPPPTAPSAVSARAADRPSAGPARTEALLQQILDEIRRHREQPTHEFAVSKMLAGIVQIMALGALVFAYFQRTQPGWLEPTLLVSLVLQTMTIALLVMSRQR